MEMVLVNLASTVYRVSIILYTAGIVCRVVWNMCFPLSTPSAYSGVWQETYTFGHKKVLHLCRQVNVCPCSPTYTPCACLLLLSLHSPMLASCLLGSTLAQDAGVLILHKPNPTALIGSTQQVSLGSTVCWPSRNSKLVLSLAGSTLPSMLVVIWGAAAVAQWLCQ